MNAISNTLPASDAPSPASHWPQHIPADSAGQHVEEAEILPEVPAELTKSELDELDQLQGQASAVESQEISASKQRGLLLRDQYRFIKKHGVARLAHHAEKVGFTYKPTKLAFSLPAQLVLNKNLAKASDANRDSLQHEVAQTARALAEMDRLAVEHDDQTEAEFTDWYRAKGQITGLAKSHLQSQKGAKAKSSSQSAGTISSEHVVETMLTNSAALEVDVLPGITSGQRGLLLYRNEGDKIRLVPLDLSLADIAALAGYVPCPMIGWPKDLRFWREALLAGESLVPDETSDIPTVEVPEGDEANSSYDMLPANGIYLVERNRISVAHGRRDDGLILEIVPNAEIELGLNLAGDCFIDNLTRRRLTSRLRGQAGADLFAKTASDGVAAPVTIKGQVKTMAFTADGERRPINLIVKPREIGTIWTHRVAPAFSPAIKAEMSKEQGKDFADRFMPLVAKKQKDRPVKIAFDVGEMQFAIDKAAPVPISATSVESAKTDVMLTDFHRALVSLLALPLVSGLSWQLDTKGLLIVEAATEVATYRVCIQTLEDNRNQPTRSRALRERVESLPKAQAA